VQCGEGQSADRFTSKGSKDGARSDSEIVTRKSCWASGACFAAEFHVRHCFTRRFMKSSDRLVHASAWGSFASGGGFIDVSLAIRVKHVLIHELALAALSKLCYRQVQAERIPVPGSLLLRRDLVVATARRGMESKKKQVGNQREPASTERLRVEIFGNQNDFPVRASSGVVSIAITADRFRDFSAGIVGNRVPRWSSLCLESSESLLFT